MKKLNLLLIALTFALMASAAPANPTPVTLQQPNGESILIKLVGDEYYHFNTTIDGYTVINNKGQWEYATRVGERLTTSGIMAHNPEARDAKELQLLSTLDKFLVDKQSKSLGLKARQTRDKKNQSQQVPVVDYNTFRGLIILINYNDKQFSMSDPNDFYDQLCNTENYTGFTHEGRFQRCTGSVRDYYYDNSMGQFDPEFDIVGPVNLDFSCYEGNNRYSEIFKAALDSVDDQVDFTQYDADNDGEIDMVFFMVAGYSSNFSGNNEGYLWPHMSYLIDWWSGWPPQPYIYDGKRMGRYASSCEIYGWEAYGYTVPNAIGTFCHEFGHVLGLPDLYDTDYEGSGGESNDPGDWDVMAGGSSSNFGRTPVGYSLWERVELGFAEPPTELTKGTKSLTALNISNSGYKLSSPNENEYFLFENRQANKWDAALPGHGLVITRVDYSNPQAWNNNEVNCDPNHNYYELIRSSGTGSGEVPFPGNGNVAAINSVTNPALVTWAGDPCTLALDNIAETNKVITFNVVDDVTPSELIEDFEAMPTSTSTSETDVMGNFGTWDFLKANIAEYEGGKAAKIKAPGTIQMTSDLHAKFFKLSLTAINSSSAAAKLDLEYSTDEGATWETIGSVEAESKSTTQLSWRLDINEPVRFKISCISGPKNTPFYIDNIKLQYIDSTDYELHVAGTQVNGINMGNLAVIDGVEGVVQYLPISKVLKLNNSSIQSNRMGISTSIEGVKLNVTGENTINSSQNGINLSQNPTITGNGSLNIKSSRNLGLSFKGNININGGVKLDIEGYNFGIVGNQTTASTMTIGGAETVINAKGDNSTTFIYISDLLLNDGLGITSPEGAYFDSDAKSIVYSNGYIISREWITISKISAILGDVNCDGSVNAADVTALYNYILNGDTTYLSTSDVNKDNAVNAGDVTAVYNIILGN